MTFLYVGGGRFIKNLSYRFFFLWAIAKRICSSAFPVAVALCCHFPVSCVLSCDCVLGTDRCQAMSAPLFQLWNHRKPCASFHHPNLRNIPSVWRIWFASLATSSLFTEMLSSSKWTQWWFDSGVLSLQIEDFSVFLCYLLSYFSELFFFHLSFPQNKNYNNSSRSSHLLILPSIPTTAKWIMCSTIFKPFSNSMGKSYLRSPF